MLIGTFVLHLILSAVDKFPEPGFNTASSNKLTAIVGQMVPGLCLAQGWSLLTSGLHRIDQLIQTTGEAMTGEAIA